MKSGFPYLVDLKITDKCSHGCPQCYQGSTKTGREANTHFVGHLLAGLRDSGVFNLAIGGGEPSEANHQLLSNTLKVAARYGFSVGVTTRNPYWWFTSVDGISLLPYLHSIGVSVDSPKEFNDRKLGQEFLREIANTEHVMTNQCGASKHVYVYLQTVVGLQTEEELFELHRLASQDYSECIEDIIYKHAEYHAMTLLGFKNTGRAIAPLHNYSLSRFFKNCKNTSNAGELKLRVGADSVIVKQYHDELVDVLGIEENCLIAGEGESTCYIDAVNKVMKTSSFSTEPGVPITETDSLNLLKIFRAL